MTGRGPDAPAAAVDDATPEQRSGLLPVLTSVVERRWTASVFGIVAPGVVRRRPSDVVRCLTAAVVVAVAAAGSQVTTAIEQGVFDLLAALPGGLTGVFEVTYTVGPIAAGLLIISALVARRPRLLLTLVLAGGVAWIVAAILSSVIDVPTSIETTGSHLHGHTPDFPVIPIAASMGVVLAARPYVTRPARRLLMTALWVMALSALYLAEGLPGAVLASVVLAWGTAALGHLALGSPGGTPSASQVIGSVRGLGVTIDDAHLDLDQTWGQTTFVSDGPDPLVIEVVGRDSSDARLFAKLWRFAWYKDAGPTLAVGREQQLEHDALTLLLADRSGAAVPELVAVGVAGARKDALLVVRNPPGRAFVDLAAEEVTDAVLDDAWANLGRLHEAGIAHGNVTARRIVVDDGGRTGLVRFDGAETSAPADHLALDDLQLLVLSAAVVGVDRALAAADRALGTDGLTDLLPFLQPAALDNRSRDDIDDLKGLLDELRTAGTERTGVDAPELAALRRFSLGGILLAAAFALGVYLLVAQLAGVAEMGDVFRGADWAWVGVTAVIAQLPQFCLAVAMLGAVSVALPLRPVTVVQFANAFTGLVGGTAGNATLVIRFFQKQGLSPTIAASSGVMNSLAGFIVQIVLVVVGLLITGSSFDFSGNGFNVPSWLLAVVAAAVLAVVAVLVIPRLRHRVFAKVTPQLEAAWGNIRGVLSTPRKAVQLFGGNLTSQILFAMTLGAALHAYGESLPLLQIIVINSFASFVGGAAPVPGGMGVVEAGMIAGFTAAGIPQAEAVAATFTARMFTTYLPPIWGWFAFQWLRHNDYV